MKMAILTSRTSLILLLYVTFCPIAALSSSKVFSKTFAAEKAAFSPHSWSLLPVNIVATHKRSNWLLKLRGGQQQMALDDDNNNHNESTEVTAVEEETVNEVSTSLEEEVVVEEEVIAAVETEEVSTEEKVTLLNKDVTAMSAFLTPLTGYAKQFGAAYAASLGTRPIITKSVTACFIFALSDYVAQRLEAKDDDGSTGKDIDTKKNKSKNKWSIKEKETVVTPTYNYVRTFTSAAVGLLYFGPAAHGWYETIFKIFTSSNIVSTLQKAALGQLLFGPSFTCVFFATSLLQAGEFTFGNWFRKIRNDLPGAWAAGLGFWPLVDVISFTFIPSQWIPLFVNFCSFIWTIYLSLVANRSTKTTK